MIFSLVEQILTGELFVIWIVLYIFIFKALSGTPSWVFNNDNSSDHSDDQHCYDMIKLLDTKLTLSSKYNQSGKSYDYERRSWWFDVIELLLYAHGG